MKFFNVCTVKEAKERIDEVLNNFQLKHEKISILDSLGRYNFYNLTSIENLPQFNRSTVDGYGIKSSDSIGCSDSVQNFLNIKGKIEMGHIWDGEIFSGEAIYIPTGGMVPKGVDSVIMIEYIEKITNDEIGISKPISFGENIIFTGDDIKKGDILLEKGKRINFLDIGKLSGMGINEVNVFKKIKFTIISTGDEIIDINEEISLGKIRDINGYILNGMITEMSGEIIKRVIVKDDFDLLKKEVELGVLTSDIVLISGGSSVGEKDYTKKVIESITGKEVFVEGIAMKPGKPTIMGERKGKLIFGLPGHPVSAILVFKIFYEHILENVLGLKLKHKRTQGILETNLHSSPGKDTYQMVSIEEKSGINYIKPIYGKSGMITLLSEGDGYIILSSEEEGLNKGEKVNVYTF